jgi:hypothetical protein
VVSKFTRDADPEKYERVRRREAERVAANTTGMADNGCAVCAACGFKVGELYRREHSITACPRCGGKECVYHALDYNLDVPSNPTPTYKQALATERANRVRRVP